MENGTAKPSYIPVTRFFLLLLLFLQQKYTNVKNVSYVQI